VGRWRSRLHGDHAARLAELFLRCKACCKRPLEFCVTDSELVNDESVGHCVIHPGARSNPNWRVIRSTVAYGLRREMSRAAKQDDRRSLLRKLSLGISDGMTAASSLRIFVGRTKVLWPAHVCRVHWSSGDVKSVRFSRRRWLANDFRPGASRYALIRRLASLADTGSPVSVCTPFAKWPPRLGCRVPFPARHGEIPHVRTS